MLEHFKHIIQCNKSLLLSASLASAIAFAFAVIFTVAGVHFFAAILIGGLAGGIAFAAMTTPRNS